MWKKNQIWCNNWPVKSGLLRNITPCDDLDVFTWLNSKTDWETRTLSLFFRLLQLCFDVKAPNSTPSVKLYTKIVPFRFYSEMFVL